MDEMKVINLHKRCNKKARKAPQLKKAPKSPKSDKPKKTPESPEFIDISSKEEQRPKKASNHEERTTTKAVKKVKKTPQPEKAPKSPGLTDDLLPLLWWVEKKEVFIRGPYEGYKLSYGATHDSTYLKRVLKMSVQDMYT